MPDLFHGIAQLQDFFLKPGGINFRALTHFNVWTLLHEILRSDPPPALLDAALACIDGAVCSHAGVGTLYLGLGFPQFFAAVLAAHRDSLARIPESALLRLLNICLQMCVDDADAQRAFYAESAFELCLGLLAESDRLAPLQTVTDLNIECRIVRLLGLFLTHGSDDRALLSELEIGQLCQIFLRLLYPSPRAHVYAAITRSLSDYFSLSPAVALRRFADTFVADHGAPLTLWRALGLSLGSAVDCDRSCAALLLADALLLPSGYTEMLLDAVDLPTLVGELLELKTVLCMELADLTVAAMGLIGAWIETATEVPADVEPSDISELCLVICDDGSLEVKVALFEMLRAVFQKASTDFLLDLVTPELTEAIFEAASGQAEDAVAPFLELLEAYLARLGREVGRYEAVDAIFRDGIAGLLCETRELSAACQKHAERLLAAYYGDWQPPD
jgi:hypothetical protein